jgi:hypothetical protein
MSVSVTFQVITKLIWFRCSSLVLPESIKPDVFEKEYEPSTPYTFDSIVSVPYEPKNIHDFIEEYRIEDKGYYARFFIKKKKDAPGISILT